MWASNIMEYELGAKKIFSAFESFQKSKKIFCIQIGYSTVLHTIVGRLNFNKKSE